MLISFPHKVEFTNERPIAVRDVAASLLANEQVVQSSCRILESVFPGLEIESVDVKFLSASTNSPLKEALSAGILLTFQDDLKREVPKLIESITGLKVEDKYTTLVTVIFIIAVIYGLEQAWQLFKARHADTSKDGAGLPSIQGNYNTVIQTGGNLLGVDPESLRRAVERSFPPKQRVTLAKQALAFIRPAKREHGAAIEGGGLVIEAEAIEAAPSDIDLELAEDDAASPENYPRQRVVIHATDRDRAKSGWAGHLPEVWEKRVPMKLFPGIEPSGLFGKDEVTADVMLTFKRNAAGEDVPDTIHVLKLYDT